MFTGEGYDKSLGIFTSARTCRPPQLFNKTIYSAASSLDEKLFADRQYCMSNWVT